MRNLIIGFWILLTGCQITGLDRVDHGELNPIDPPGIYSLWYDDMEDCLDERGNFHAIKWFTSKEVMWDSESANALWMPGSRIILHERVFNAGVGAERIVKHEMIHDIMWEGFTLHGDPAMDCQYE